MFRFFNQPVTIATFSFIVITIALLIIYFFMAPKLPNADVFKEINLQVPLRIFSVENKLIESFT